MAANVTITGLTKEQIYDSIVAPPVFIRNTTAEKIKSVALQLQTYNFTEMEVSQIARYYKDANSKTGYIKKTTSELPVSLVYIDKKDVQEEHKSTKPGLYLLLKAKLTKAPVAQGSWSKITWAYHWESEQMHVFRSLKYKHLGDYEILFNRQLSAYPQCFATGLIFSYQSTWSRRSLTLEELALIKSKGMKNRFYYQKAGCILPYYKNGPLSKWLNNIYAKKIPPFTPLQYVKFALHLAKSLQMMHQQGFVHLDIKKENILIDDEGLPKIIDFGIAGTTLPTGVSGSPGSTSPQRAFFDKTGIPVEATFADDIWCFGGILPLLHLKDKWYLWCRFNHKRDLTNEAAVTKKVEELFPADEFPNTLIRKCLVFDPQKRATMMQVVEQLEIEEIRLTTALESAIVPNHNQES